MVKATQAPESVPIASRRWIDSFQGFLVLSNGREILLTALVDSEVTGSGAFERVIRRVATMTAPQVLEMLRAPGGSLADQGSCR